ncbi:MAG TPA: Na+:solute symporter [Bacteroidales bacterium]|nr:Na+:solute symporter [Bacteroidales bacterium]
MALAALDWGIILLFFVGLIAIAIWASKSASKSAANFFVSGRSMPWWLLGVSMVATTFSADTPNLVTDMVRQNGVSSNWMWWAFLFTGMLTVFVYAKLWNRSKVLTDLEFYEIRYSGNAAAFLRGFRAIYLGGFFNIMVIASVSLALIKISAVMIGWPAERTLVLAAIIVVFYSALGGLRSILFTDFYQFSIAMAGAFGAAYFVVNSPDVGGLTAMLEHPAVIPKLSFFPDLQNTELLIAIFIIPLAVQWWSVWYPGAEPGGGGYIAQRMLSAKNEKNAMGATLLFNFFHYALRPWPWILVALGSMIVFPDIASMQNAFPNVDPGIIRNDFAYPAMLSRYLPVGFLGLVVASLIAAFMSTTASQLNWGSSYLVNDFYARFINKTASEKQKVMAGRLSTIILMFFAVLFALVLKNALQAFNILLQIGAGTGLIYILRWFWWRINVWTEITGMVSSFLIAIGFMLYENQFALADGSISLFGTLFSATSWGSIKIVSGVLLTSVLWISVTFLTPPVDDKTLLNFYKKIKPGGFGWKKLILRAKLEGHSTEKELDLKWDVPTGILCMILGSIAVYGVLFATGYFIYSNWLWGSIFSAISLISSFALFKSWGKLTTQ